MEANLMVSPTHHFEQISELIENARSILDLNMILEQLIPLPELKKILLDKLTILKTHEDDNCDEHAHCTDTNNPLSIHSIYFNSYPFDEIFSSDIICSTIQYLSGSNMYGKLSRINKNFNKIMKNNPILYQQYKIQVTLSDDTWSPSTKQLYINISHQLQRIVISASMQQPYNTAIPLNSKIAPDHANNSNQHRLETNTIIITSVEDMTKRCPFVWFAIRKWHIITHLSDYDQDTLMSPYIQPSATFPDIAPQQKEQHTICLMEQLLMKCAPYIRSLQIDERIMAGSPNCSMYGLYTLVASSNLYLNYSHELNSKKKHMASSILNKLLSLNDLVHIEWITDESAPILESVYFHSCTNIVCMSLCGSQGYTLLNASILSNLHRLLVFSIEFDDVKYMTPKAQSNNVNNAYEDDQYNIYKIKEEETQKTVVQFPKNIEFIQFNNFDHAGDIILDLSQCYNIVAIKLTLSTENYTLSNITRSIQWPKPVGDNYNHLIECLLMEYEQKAMYPSHARPVWNGIQTLMNSNKLPIKCIRYVSNAYTQPMCFQIRRQSYDSNAETVVRGIGESKEDNSELIKGSTRNVLQIRDSIYNDNGDGVLWKTLIRNKYNTDTDVSEKMLIYKKYFDMDVMKWVYHLGRECGTGPSTSFGAFDSSSFPVTTIGVNDRSTISNNTLINPQYLNINELWSSSSAVFAVD